VRVALRPCLCLRAPSALNLELVNQSEKPDSDVYVTLFAGGAYNAGSSPTTLR